MPTPLVPPGPNCRVTLRQLQGFLLRHNFSRQNARHCVRGWLGVTGETHVDLVRRINPSQTLPGSVDYSQAIFGMMAIAGTGWSKIEGGSRVKSATLLGGCRVCCL